MEAKHRYTVEATRQVGKSSYYLDVKKKVFAFGKNQAYPDGKGAKAAAEGYAQTLMEKANSVSVTKWVGGRGLVTYLKDDKKALFDLSWHDLALTELQASYVSSLKEAN